jgi:predicted RecA/RadA family phage recombinase
MTKYIHSGIRVPYTNATGSTIASDAVVNIVTGTSGHAGVAMADIANGATGQLQVQGVVSLDKTTGEAMTLGQVVYWVTSTSKVSGTATSNHRIGRVAKAAGSAATSAEVNLNVY